LDAGANTNMKNVDGKTALMLAVEKGHDEIEGLFKEARTND
jgi:ankyrin repeat protein